MEYCIIICFITPMVLFALGIAGIIVGHFMKRETMKNLGKCLATWTTLFFLLPVIAKRAGFINNILVGWIVALLAPPLFVLYGLVYGLWAINQPLPYDELRFTSHDEIAAITEIPDFPQFKYVRNSHDGWDGTTTTWNEFTDSIEVARLFAHLDSIVGDKDNIYWSRDTLFNDDLKTVKEVFYIYNRGWDGEYVKCPKGIKDSLTQVSMQVYHDGFIITPEPYWTGGIEDYANPGTLNKITGVDFPSLEFVNAQFNDYFVDAGWNATAKMKYEPSTKFISELKSADNWTEQKDGTFTFHLVDRDGDLYEDITVDPDSRFVKFSRSTH